MKKFLLLFLSLFVFFQTHSQEGDGLKKLKDAYDRLDSIDKKSIKTDKFLNKGFFFKNRISEFLKFEDENLESYFSFVNPSIWEVIYQGLSKSFLKQNSYFPQTDVQKLIENAKEFENTVPIGILCVEGEYLEDYDIDENIDAVKYDFVLDKKYKKYKIFNGGILKQTVNSGNIKFEVLEDLFFVEKNTNVKSVSIDFADGQGFREVSAGETINIDYDSEGEKAIAVKFTLSQGREFINYSTLYIVTLKKEEPDLSYDLGFTTSSNKDLNTADRGSGFFRGQALVFNGCDGVFDKPVIYVEGFDPTGTSDIYKIQDRFQRGNIEGTLRRNGYDIIYLNFYNGADDIKRNADVLEQLIETVNDQKIGNNDIIIIGESMGGLVARYALTSMENASRTHNVSHFISFDTPHLGANIPVGYQKLIEDIDDLNIFSLLNISISDVEDAMTGVNSKAAKQMLLRRLGPNPHADFISFQSELQNLGFPSQGGIKNLSVVNAAVNGSVNEPQLDYNPGDKLLDVDFVNALSGFIVVRTNGLNTNTKVSSLIILTLGVPTTVKEDSYNFNGFNYDLVAGGTESNQTQNISPLASFFLDVFNFATYFGGHTVNDFGNSRFSFVPLFSSAASTAPRTVQSHLNRSVAQLEANNWTPFDKIYGENSNSNHVLNDFIVGAWERLFQDEFGFGLTSFCNQIIGSSAPPVPRINTDFWYTCEVGSRTLFIVDDGSEIGNLYTHTWTVTGPTSFSLQGKTLKMGPGLPVGTYTISLRRSYSSGSGFSGSSNAMSRTFTVYDEYHPIYGCSEGDNPGGGIRKSDDIGKDDEPKENKITDESEFEKGIDIWPNPVNGQLNIRYSMQTKGDISITLFPITNFGMETVTITNSYRPRGQYEETFYTSGLREGIYVLEIKTDFETLKFKIILER